MADKHIREIERVLGRSLTAEEIRLLHLAKAVEEQIQHRQPAPEMRQPTLQPAH